MPCMLADQDGCGVHMAWEPGPRILTLIFRTTVIIRTHTLTFAYTNFGAQAAVTTDVPTNECAAYSNMRNDYAGGDAG